MIYLTTERTFDMSNSMCKRRFVSTVSIGDI